MEFHATPMRYAPDGAVPEPHRDSSCPNPTEGRSVMSKSEPEDDRDDPDQMMRPRYGRNENAGHRTKEEAKKGRRRPVCPHRRRQAYEPDRQHEQDENAFGRVSVAESINRAAQALIRYIHLAAHSVRIEDVPRPVGP